MKLKLQQTFGVKEISSLNRKYNGVKEISSLNRKLRKGRVVIQLVYRKKEREKVRETYMHVGNKLTPSWKRRDRRKRLKKKWNRNSYPKAREIKENIHIINKEGKHTRADVKKCNHIMYLG